MANAKQGLVLKNNNQLKGAKQAASLGVLVNSQEVKDRFERMLGKKAPAFLSSLLTMSVQNKALGACTPNSVLSAAAIAASLDLPVNPSLGCAWIIPYKGVAQFQMAAKGFIQLAQRSGLMKKINVQTVYEGEMIKHNRFTEEYEFDEDKRSSDVVIGYYAYFELINGFTKSEYWTKDAVVKHAKRHSKTFGNGPWQTDFDKMAEKTVLKAILSRYAPLSTEMQTAFENDEQAVNNYKEEDGSADYIDIQPEEIAEEDISPVENAPDEEEIDTVKLFEQ